VESEAAALVIERISGPILHQRMKLAFERGNDGDFILLAQYLLFRA
jgi:hypothetical protein